MPASFGDKALTPRARNPPQFPWDAVTIPPPLSRGTVLQMKTVSVQLVMRTAYKGASMRMRLIAILAVLTASVALGGCFFHHNHSVMVAPESLPPLK
jgi:hypothetical protein